MPRTDSRVSVTISRDTHQILLSWWAALTGRSQANLASHLLETALTDALRNGDVPEDVANAYEQFINAMAESKAEEFQQAIVFAKEQGG